MQHVLRASRNLVVEQASDAFEVSVDTDIDNVEFSAMQAREHVHRCTLAKKVQDHLIRDFPGIGAHTFRGNAMVRRKDIDCFDQRLREVLLTNRNNLRGKVFQPAEAAERFGQGVEMRPGLLPQRFAGRFDGADDVVEQIGSRMQTNAAHFKFQDSPPSVIRIPERKLNGNAG